MQSCQQRSEIAADGPQGPDTPDAQREGEFWDEVEHRWRPLPPFARWLGHWRHAYEGMDHLALVMRVSSPPGLQAAEVLQMQCCGM